MANRAWEQWYPAGVTWDMPLPPAVALETLLEGTAQRLPDAIAIDFYERVFAYRELHQLATQAAKGLQLLGVGPGVHVGLHLPNSPHFVICFFASIVLHLRFDPERVLADISAKKITLFLGVPTMYTALINHPKFAEFDLSSVSMWSSGGAPLPLDVQQRFESLTGHSPREGYGLTETAPLGTLSVPEGPVRQGSVGVPAPHTLVEVVDLDTGMTPLPPGERGEICLRGPQVMKGYWKNPAATEQALRGGRFHTGDIGFMGCQVILLDTRRYRSSQTCPSCARVRKKALCERGINVAADSRRREIKPPLFRCSSMGLSF